MTPTLRCTTHPGEAAGWRCTDCGALLCPACAVVLRVAGTESDGCARCRGLAERIRVRRQEARPFASWIPGAFRYPLRRGALLSILALALVMRILQAAGGMGTLLASAIYWSFLFGVIVQGWQGKEELEPPDFRTFIDDLLFPALRGLLATLVVWLPVGLRAVSLASRLVSQRFDPVELATLMLKDPVIWLLLLLGAAYLPAALIAAAISRSFLAVLNPLVSIQMARVLGQDYVRAALMTAGLGLAGPVAEVLAQGSVGKVPVIGSVLVVAVGAYLQVVSARILGLLVHVRGDDLDLGQSTDYLDPLLPGASPLGGTVELEPAPRRPRATDGELRDGPPPVARAVPVRGGPDPAGEPLETVAVERPAATDPPGDPWAVPALTPRGEVQAAVSGGDLQRAYDLYRKAGGRIDGLGAAELFHVARGAARAGDHPVAAWALTAAAAFADDPVAPDVLLVLGRIYGARLGKAAEARQTFEALIARYPASRAAEQARAELAAGG